MGLKFYFISTLGDFPWVQFALFEKNAADLMCGNSMK
jgi:hypothetical protein